MKPAANSAREIFVELVNNVPPDQWDQRLAEAAGGDTALADRVRALLDAHAGPGSFLERPAVGEEAPTIEGEFDLETPGAVIGRYTLIEPIGEGGFGVVYLAEQTEPLRRQVALKVIKPGMDSKQVIARFEAERQALALMDHPNIAKVLDAGTTAPTGGGYPGRPYFVMELVKGVPITDYCDRCHLTTRERLDLFADVCHAVQHAHQKGVIHRDLKPSNVLVAMQDDEPAPKVIDFGVAKAVGQKLTAHTLQTRLTQMIGTPSYMSPEQAELSPIDVDTRSDVYSLGVLLYELLTGQTPLSRERLVRASFDEVRRIIREEEPPRPSTRVSTLAAGDAVTIAQRRRIDTRHLTQQLRGELDWIVLRALEKDRRRRYESPGAFAADVQRYLHDEAVDACPPSRGYRLRKLIRRHRGLFTAAAATMAALLIGLAVATYAFVIAERRRVEAEQESSRAQRIAQVLSEMLESADPSMGKGEDYTVRAMLDDFAATLDGRFDDDPLVEATIRKTIGRAYFYLGLPNVAEPHLRRALALCNAHLHSQLVEAGILTDLAQTLMFTTGSRDEFAEPEDMVRKAIGIYRKEADVNAELADSLGILGWVLYFKTNSWHFSGRENEGETVNREGLQLLGGYTDKRSLTVKGKMCVGLAFELLRGEPADLNEAADYAARAVDLLRTNNPHDHFMCLALLVNGLCQLRLGNVKEAEFSLREAKAVEERASGTVSHERLRALMAVLFQQGKFTEALDLARSRSTPPPGPLPPKYVTSEIAVGMFLLGLGDAERAEAQLAKARDMGLAHLGEDHPATIGATFRLAQALAGQDDTEKQAQARVMFAALLPRSRAHPQTVEPLSYGYVTIVGHLKSPTSADLERALETNQRILGQPLLPTCRLRNLYAGALVKNHAGSSDEAMAYLREIIESPAAYQWDPMKAGEPFFILRNAEDLLARMLVESGRSTEAEEVYRDAIARRRAAEHPDTYQIIYAGERLARFLIEEGDHEEAHELLIGAQEQLTGAPACIEWLKRRVDEDLETLNEPQLSHE